MSMFAKAKAKVATPKKDDKLTVVIPGAEFSKSLARFNQLKVEVANLTTELKELDGSIKEIGVEKFVELYDSMKRNPGTFKLASDDGDKVMLIAMDRYISVADDIRANELKESWGDEIVEENVTYSFNNELLTKHQDKIEELLMSADFLSEKEKEELIVGSTKYNVKKGAINDAMTVGKGKIVDFLGDIQPVVQLKQTK